MITALQGIAEQRIEQFFQEGRGEDLSHWKNKPLPLKDDMANVPAHLRMAYRILKNAGYVPEEVTIRKEIANLESMLANCSDEQIKIKQMKKLDFLRYKFESRTGKTLPVRDSAYRNKLIDNITIK